MLKYFPVNFKKSHIFFILKIFNTYHYAFIVAYTHQKKISNAIFQKNYMFCSSMTKNFGKIYPPTNFKILLIKSKFIYTIKIKVDFTTISARKVFAPKGHFLFHK